MYIILYVQLLSELEWVAAVPAEMESEQEDLHQERIFLVAEVNINDLTCSEDVVCVEILLSTQRKQPENTSNSYICLLSCVACVQLESGVYLFGNILLC